MKVLLMSPLPPPVGGIATWTKNILSYYQSNNILIENLEIYHQNTSIKNREITDRSFLKRIFSGIINGIIQIFSLIYNILIKRPDVVHLTSSGSLALIKDILVLLICKILFVPLVIHFRFGRIPEIKKSNTWEWNILKNIVVKASACIVLDNESYESLNESGLKNIYLVPNPISKVVEDYAFEITSSDSYNTAGPIIFVGHVIKSKGVYELAEAYHNLSSSNSLVFIGPYEDDIKEDILKKFQNININFLGPKEKKIVLDTMKNASMLVLPSYTEGFPNVIIEAMAMKCPIIATNVGAIPSILSSENGPLGIVIEPKDSKGLSTAISHLSKNQNLAQDMINNSFEKVMNEYTLDKVFKQYIAIWKKLI